MHTDDAPPELRMRAALLGKPIASPTELKNHQYLSRCACCFTCSQLINLGGKHCQKYQQDPDPKIPTLMRQICSDWTP